MPSEDSKALQKEPVKEEQGEEDADGKSLSSILSARKKNPTNGGSLTPKSRPKITKVKKEEPREVDDDDFDAPIKGKGGSSGSRAKSIAAKVKKEENVVDDDDDDDRRPVSKRNSATKVNQDLSKKKKEKEEEKKKKKKKKGSTTTEQNGKKREKKVYDLPGQKRDPPEERDPLRIFYETLYRQVPQSDMAQIWMMESGLLSMEAAKKVCDEKQKKNGQKLSSPLKAATPAKRTESKTLRKSTPTSAKMDKADPKISSKQSKKRKTRDGSPEDDSDEDFLASVSEKKQRAS